MSNTKSCKCPFCETELEQACFEPPFCKSCNVKLIKCKKCNDLYEGHLGTCPKCGATNER